MKCNAAENVRWAFAYKGRSLRLALAGVIFALCGCGTDLRSNGQLLQAVDHSLLIGGRLCTGPLALPDKTPQRAIRRRFEDMLVQVGVFKRSGDTFRVNAGHSSDILVLKKGTRSTTEVGAVCFGSIHATRIISDIALSRGDSLIEFAFHVQLAPWSQRLRPSLHFPQDRTSRALMRSSGARHDLEVVLGAKDGVNFLPVLWPPNGANWYPDGLPPNVRWHQGNITV